jgi:uncharacterized membrane protein YkgB
MSAMMTGATPLPRHDDPSALGHQGQTSRTGATIATFGGGMLRYGLVGILLYLGAFKFTATEAEAIRPLMETSPFLSWLYLVTSTQGASNAIGAAELIIAVLLALRPVAPRLTAIGSVGAIFMFLTTLSFLVTMPGIWESAPDFPLPLPNIVGWFLLKDLFLLGAAVWSLGEALQAASRR